MMSVVLIAVMLDRPALTMRNVAIAALAVLLVMPQSLFDPSFEMSFAAVVGLLAVFEYLSIAACGLALAPVGTRPDILIDREGKTVALRGESNSLALPPATHTDYSTENWLLADGDDRDVAAAATGNVFRCDNAGCIGKVKGKTIALVRRPSALEEDCRLADIVVAPFTVTKACRSARIVVDRKMLKEHGAYALYIEGLSIRSETVAEARGARPWVPEHPPPMPAPDLSVGHAFAQGDGSESDDESERPETEP